jgi:aminoglycoside/choline kinase family phosphotransferase
VDEKAGIYLEEDLGETTLFDAVTQARRDDPGADFPQAMLPVYRRIVELLPRFQVEGGKVIDYSLAYPRAAFDRQSILWDLNYFKYHFLKLAHIPFNEARLEKDFRRFATFLLAADTRHFLYRDFQSRNMMLRDGEPWFIDYQGGRRGALQYDVASLLYDPKVGMTETVREELLELYLTNLEQLLPVDRDRFRQHLRGYVLVRIMQAMGAYGYRGFYERKPRFLQSVPQAVRNIESMLETGFVSIELPELQLVFERRRCRGSPYTSAASATSAATRKTAAGTAAASSSTAAPSTTPAATPSTFRSAAATSPWSTSWSSSRRWRSSGRTSAAWWKATWASG